MPGPRAGSATVRASSSLTTAIAEEAEVLPAELRRHLQQPQPKLAGLRFELLADLRLEIRAVHRVHLDRDQFPIDEPPHRVLEDPDLLRQLKIHPRPCPFVSAQILQPALHNETYVRCRHASTTRAYGCPRAMTASLPPSQNSFRTRLHEQERSMTQPSASTALDNLTVIDLTRVRAGPTCVRQLADWGAKVIKIEMPEDGPASTQTDFSARHEPDFQNLHRNKRSMTLNLKRRRRRRSSPPPGRARRCHRGKLPPRREDPGSASTMRR